MGIQERAWKGIERSLAARISSGECAPGTQLPTQAELAREFNASRYNVRLALEALRRSGIVDGWQGPGYFLSRSEFCYQINDRTSLAGSLRAAGAEVELQVVRQYLRRPPVCKFSDWLGVPKHVQLPTGEVLHLADGIPVGLGRHYFHPERFADILPRFCANVSARLAFAERGLTEYTRRETAIRTRLPTQDEANLLDIPHQQPVFHVSGCNVDKDGVPIEVTEAVVRGDRTNLVVS